MMKKQAFYLAAGLLFSLGGMVTSAQADTFIEARAGGGEWRNIEDTEEYLVKGRYQINDYMFISGKAHKERHVRRNNEINVFAGGGLEYIGFNGEVLFGEDAYEIRAWYEVQDIGNLRLRGGFFHSNLYQEGDKRDALEVSGGYVFADHIEVGAYYRVGNQNQKDVDDIGGGYIKYVF